MTLSSRPYDIYTLQSGLWLFECFLSLIHCNLIISKYLRKAMRWIWLVLLVQASVYIFFWTGNEHFLRAGGFWSFMNSAKRRTLVNAVHVCLLGSRDKLPLDAIVYSYRDALSSWCIAVLSWTPSGSRWRSTRDARNIWGESPGVCSTLSLFLSHTHKMVLL